MKQPSGRPCTLAELATAAGCECRGDAGRVVSAVAPLHSAGPDSITFLSDARHRGHLAATRAGAVILDAASADDCPTAALVSANPYAAYARVAQQIYPRPLPSAGIHPSAVVDDGARLGSGVAIGAQAVVGRDCRLFDDVIVGPGCVVGDGVEIGAASHLVANVTICHGVRIGARVLVQPGAVVGADGFGFANDAGEWVKIPQIGSVVVGDDVEIGANTTIDRGTLGDTVIGDGVKLDNQIMVAHNVSIGSGSALAGCVGIAGSAVIGARCTVGGGVGITGHVEVADDVHVTGMSFVNRPVDEAGVYSSGMPLMDNRTWRKNMVRLKQLDELARRLAVLEKRFKGR